MTRALSLCLWLAPLVAAAQSQWSVVLVDPGPNKILCIKEVRAATGKGLKDAKDFVEAKMPQVVREGLSEAEARAFGKALEGAGAKVEVRSSGAVVAKADGAAEAQRTTGFAVKLEAFGASKIQCIKVVRDATGLGLAETKKLVESAPIVVKEGLTKAQAEVLAKQLLDVGAKASLVEPKP